jgi:transcriptional regulator with XRE-family HTH domain
LKRRDILTLYDKIKSMADDQNLSISYIEENTNLSNGSISKWKTNSPRVDSLNKVAKLLGCSLDFLMYAHDDTQEFSGIYSGSLIGENSRKTNLFLNENEIEILNILKRFKTYRNQIKFIARVELLANEMLSDIEDNEV